MTAYQNHDNQINAEENEIFLGVGNELWSKEHYHERFAQRFHDAWLFGWKNRLNDHWNQKEMAIRCIWGEVDLSTKRNRWFVTLTILVIKLCFRVLMKLFTSLNISFHMFFISIRNRATNVFRELRRLSARVFCILNKKKVLNLFNPLLRIIRWEKTW